jgi:hypothetical protein
VGDAFSYKFRDNSPNGKKIFATGKVSARQSEVFSSQDACGNDYFVIFVDN